MMDPQLQRKIPAWKSAFATHLKLEEGPGSAAAHDLLDCILGAVHGPRDSGGMGMGGEGEPNGIEATANKVPCIIAWSDPEARWLYDAASWLLTAFFGHLSSRHGASHAHFRALACGELCRAPAMDAIDDETLEALHRNAEHNSSAAYGVVQLRRPSRAFIGWLWKLEQRLAQGMTFPLITANGEHSVDALLGEVMPVAAEALADVLLGAGVHADAASTGGTDPHEQCEDSKEGGSASHSQFKLRGKAPRTSKMQAPIARDTVMAWVLSSDSGRRIEAPGAPIERGRHGYEGAGSETEGMAPAPWLVSRFNHLRLGAIPGGIAIGTMEHLVQPFN